MERVWKKDQALRAVENTMEFIRSYALSSRSLVYVTFKEKEEVCSSLDLSLLFSPSVVKSTSLSFSRLRS